MDVQVPVARMDRTQSEESLGQNYFDTHNPNFKKYGARKIRFIADLLSVGVSPITSDADVIWIRDPRKYFVDGSFASADILVTMTTPAANPYSYANLLTTILPCWYTRSAMIASTFRMI